MAAASSSGRGRPRHLALELLLAAAAACAAVALLELGARGWWRLRHDGYGRARAEEELALKVGPMRERVPRIGADLEGRGGVEQTVPHPYFGWDSDPSRIEWALSEAERCRAGRPADELLIMVLGGSVASGFAGRSEAVLQELLGADPRLAGERVRVANHAREAYKQPQQVMVLGYMLAFG